MSVVHRVVVLTALVPLIVIAGVLALIAFWLISFIEVLATDEARFRAAGTSKPRWLLVVILGSTVGAAIWRFGRRKSILSARLPAA